MQREAKFSDRVAALAATLLASVGVWPLLRIGWVPSDEGTLAQSALRVYQGQLPHRDFAEIYTGGLAMWHALAFRMLGVNLFSLRLATWFLFVLWVPVIYWIARRWLSPTGAFLATLTATAWSYPNYVAAMPSWYNLFFATFGVAALLRYVEKRTLRWLVLAGVFAGLSVLVKITGLYFIAAALIWFAWMEQGTAMQSEGRKSSSGWAYRLVCGLGLVGYVVALTKLLAAQLHSGEVYSLLLPSLLCVGLWFWRERDVSASGDLARFAAMLKMVLPFLAGALAVVACFAAPYVRSGSLRLLLHGIFQSVGERAVGLAGRTTMPGVEYALYSVLLLGIIVFALRWPSVAARRSVIVVIALVLLGMVVVSSVLPGLQDTWMMAGMATPLVIALGVWRIRKGQLRGLASDRALLLIVCAAVCSLVQFPVSYVTYFCYIAPLVLLAAVAVLGDERRPLFNIVMGFLLLFGCFALVPKHVYNPQLQVARTQPMLWPRGGLRVDDSTNHFAEIIPLLQQHSPNGLLYAGNDCPELYFLSGLKNPTRDDTGASSEVVLEALRSGTLHVVALNDASFFAAGDVSPELRAAIAQRLPHSQKVGAFSIYWD